MSGKISVLLVDDSDLIRRLLARILQQNPRLEIVGEARDGKEGVELAKKLRPQIVILDIEMPVMSGLEALPKIKEAAPLTKIIMFSTMTENGAKATLDALTHGADDYVTKPSNTGSFAQTAGQISTELVPKIIQFADSAAKYPNLSAYKKPVAPVQTDFSWARVKAKGLPEVVVIGVSTGGPQALAELVPHLPGDFPVPILVVQHMPAMFTRLLAERLDASSKLSVREGKNGETIKPGQMVFAPGEYHMYLKREGDHFKIMTDQAPPVNECRPAVDPLFKSAVEACGSRVLGVILTGMGNDGLEGSRAIKNIDGTIFCQDQQTSVVWGMPGLVAKADLADKQLPLTSIASAITSFVKGGK